jgi:small subunit ribosomal protein S7
MSRKGQSKIRKLKPDAKYQSEVIAKLINYSTKNGNKTPAAKQVYQALEILQKETKSDDVLVTFETALGNIRPKVEVRPRRIGGAVYQVPTPVRGHRQLSLAIRWLVAAARSKSNKELHSYGDKLSAELLAALKNEGSAVTKRADVEKMADANKAFAHLRW